MNEQIEEVLDAFDFDYVKKIMMFLDWKWGAGADAYIPSYNELRRTAKQLLEDTYLQGRCVTGGLEAEDSDGILRLVFIVTQSEAGGE